ncbi:ribosome maturation factor RimM [Chamaesiphon minutus]|uniref:Ribosome maturation factor RimM n=1 Tax=Chamaesiphon minutus (strain ATCC 27169 / PCC 6605) TaxID=1173020 RepID=K9UHN8_CHAP6|nr:ribosome maturation factor RimM [Chamaesiphon minutus]AFY94300.1 16S rRNA processing protein RimM [Chamaesiphon minutus PCC 6605]
MTIRPSKTPRSKVASGTAPLVPPDGWMEIGSIVGAQGIKGEVKVYPNSDFPERFERAGERWLWGATDVEPRSIQLQKGYEIPGKGLFVVQLAGIETRSQAENLRGQMLLLPATDRPRLSPGEYHSQDLIGLPVFHGVTGVEVGTVADIFTAGHEILVVSVPNGDGKIAEAMIPFVKEIVPVVDLANRRIEILPPPGLLELYVTAKPLSGFKDLQDLQD